jgi:hypothetical protein
VATSETPPPVTQLGGRPATLASILRKVIWLIAVAAMGFGTIDGFLTIYTQADSAPQQAAAGAIACFQVITPYVLARGLDELLTRW